ncbi:pentatricopeptide repeat-containing protein At3g09650, chloroplastic [Nymphaea colorata]|uniref:At1g68980-like TPR repeats domain-containing protein n=1 Tax=Nymphaea colorata TaxID=210225 RepID=A0A5K1D7D4_9MAGN|nr:pentatricopeptide repeat-containing protein At3g09650, chloroplastic [Nymphaea colorata]
MASSLAGAATTTTATGLLSATVSTSEPTSGRGRTRIATSTSSSTAENALLVALRERRTEDAWVLYSRASDLPNSTCLSRLVCQLAYQQTPVGLSRAQSIFRRLRREKQLGRLDCNSLGLLAVSAAKSGDTVYASAIVNSMLKTGYFPHVKAWSAVLSRLDDAEAAITLFDAVCRHYQQLTDIGTADVVMADMKPDCGAFNAVLNACANAGNAREFARIFGTMDRFSVKPDVLTFNIMIKLCARLEKKHLLVRVLEKMVEAGISPCITTFHSLVAAYVGLGDLGAAENLVQAMREGRRDIIEVLRDTNLESNRQEPCLIENSVLELSTKSALQIKSSYYPDARIYTTLMKGYMQQGRVNDVVIMLKAMKKQDDKLSQPDHVTYTTVITAFVNNCLMDEARMLLTEMAVAKIPATRVTYNVLLKGYCQMMQMEKADALVQEMKENGLQLDAVSYNILIDGCILVDDSMRALSYFNEMRTKGIAPTKVSYTTLMKAFAVAGQPKLVVKVFDEMLQDPRVKVDDVAWNMLIDGYCRLGLIEEGKKVFKRMKENGVHPTVATYGSLANAIAIARKPGEALLLWNEIKQRCNGEVEAPPLKPDEGLLGTLADICVRAAFFKKALEIVACMEENGIPPNKTKYRRIYIEMHSKMFTSKHASKARQERRSERKRAAEAFKFWLGLPNAYYGSEWRLESPIEDGE